MNKKTIKVVYDKEATRMSMPREGDIGIDLYANVDDFIVYQTANLIPTGIFIEMPPGYALMLKDRSSVSKYCHVLAGICDNRYRGQVFVRMYCHTIRDAQGMGSERGYTITKGDKIAQALIVPDLTSQFEIVEVDELSETERGSGGFGSTGK